MQKLNNLKVDPEIYAFKQGKNYECQNFLGSRLCNYSGQDGALFRVWAPGARAVSVVGDFNNWAPGAHPMKNLSKTGVWQCFVPGLAQYDIYKYCITSADDDLVFKADPYAYHTETRPSNGSKLYDLAGYKWGDGAWQRGKRRAHPIEEPMNIYEVNLGSWRLHDDGNPYSYHDLADALIPYAKEMGYTHLELMPITEYPYDGSWGYQCTGYFAPTSRYGTPEDFMYFVDCCHKAGLGVIMDWVPAHFPKDEFGLYRFDGTPCYEDSNPQRAEHREWGTMVFDYGRPEVQCFLISSALFWLDVYHIDGLRVDAVASMLYLDYNRKPGEWQPNTKGGRENFEAIDLLRKLNTAIFKEHPGVIMAAEESTAWPLVTAPVNVGGLGFNFKWNMGWMNDTLAYMSTDPFFRKGSHGKLTFSFVYAFSENYILPLSHDEVVHGKHSLIEKMPGEYDEKFAGLRTLYGFMTAHPGKKLLFMGSEFGQFREWDEYGQLDWMLLGYERHSQMQQYCRELNAFYLQNPALWQLDSKKEGYLPVVMDDEVQNILVFARSDGAGNMLIACCNFAPVQREEYSFGVPVAGSYKEVFNSGELRFGGTGTVHNPVRRTRAKPMHGFAQHISVQLPAMSVVFFAAPATKAAPKAKTTRAKAGKAVVIAPTAILSATPPVGAGKPKAKKAEKAVATGRKTPKPESAAHTAPQKPAKARTKKPAGN